jgi:O-antigen/teichoic acid export membrane protein
MTIEAAKSLDLGATLTRDARDLKRGVATNLFGYLLKLGNPVLLVLVVRAYGADAFGLFTFAQAVMLFAARVAVYGFDKGLLWWVPRQSHDDKRGAIRPTLATISVSGAAVVLAIVLGAQPAVLHRFGADPGAVLPLRIMALGVLPQIWMDVLVHASLGMRRMAAQVFVTETAVPAAFVISALVFYALGLSGLGLALSFVVSNSLGVIAALFAFRSAFAGTRWPAHEGVFPPRELVRYSGPMWLSELGNSLLQRVDTYAIAFLTNDLALVGIYAVVTRFANAIRQIRRSFDPIVLAIASEISAQHDPERLAASYSRATFLVGVTQVPFFAAIWIYADLLMPWFGPGFAAGAQPLVVLCGFWIVQGAVSLAGIVVSAYGHSRYTAQNVIVAIVVLGVACLVLIPRFGLVGAACAVGLGYTAQAGFQLVQMRVITGSWNYRPIVLEPFRLAVLSAAAATAAWLGARALALPDGWPARSLEFGAFAIVYGLGVHRLWKRGLL